MANSVTNSPILIDLYGLGYPDLLSGSKEWKKDRKTGASGVSAYRAFDLNLTQVKYSTPVFWEWVGPRSGILVHWVKDAPTEFPVKLDGSYLFGNHTFGRQGKDAWAHGYQPLAMLDANKDSQLTEAELSKVWIWVDKNSNALVDKDEMVPSSSLVTSIKTKADVDKVGNVDAGAAEAPEGAVLKDGSTVPTWDWWSRSWKHTFGDRYIDGYDRGEPTQGLRRIRSCPLFLKPLAPMLAKTHPSSVYYWGTAEYPDSGGYLRFITLGDSLYVIGVAQSAKLINAEYPYYKCNIAKVEPHGKNKIKWVFDLVFGEWRDTTIVTVSDGTLLGAGVHDDARGQLHDPDSNFSYSWVAESLPPDFNHGRGLPVYLALTSFSEEMLVKALKAQNPEPSLLFVGAPRKSQPVPLTTPELIKVKFPGVEERARP